MKYIKTLLFVLMLSGLFGQVAIDQIDKLIEEKKYQSAFALLHEKDPDNRNPELVLKKTDIALSYFVKSLMHQVFAFKDLADDEDLYELREHGENESFSMYTFPVNEILDTLIVQYPENFALHKSLGYFYYEVHLKYGENWLIEDQDILDRMYEHCKIAADNHISDYMTHYCMGYYLTLQENYGDAIPHFLKSIKQDSTFATTYYNLSICYLYTDQSATGANYAIKSIDLYDDPEYKADAARVTAFLFKDTQDYDNALKYYKLSDQIEPENYYTLNQLLELQLDLGLVKEAEETAGRFFELDPTNPQICSDLVEIYIITNSSDELQELFDRLIGQFQDDKEVLGNIYFHRGQFYRTKEDPDKARDNFLKARENLETVFDKEHIVFQLIEEALR